MSGIQIPIFRPEVKGKAFIVPFDRITSQYSYFKEIWIFSPIQQGTDKTEKKNMFCFGSVLYWTQSEKFVYTNQQRFAFQIQMLTAICCTYCEVDSLKPS